MAAQKQQLVDEVDNREILKQIEQRMSELGDLPIFSASLNKIRRVSKDEDSDAMSLAVEVMKDANLVTKLLQLANSPYYNRGFGKIASVSRSVILLGFETISSLCLTLKLIDSFNSEHPSVDMNLMLVNAFLTAGMAREIAEKAGIKDVEESYICGLLHGLGEIIVAYALPEKYDDMSRQSRETDVSWGKIQQQELGGSFYLIGRKLAEQWGFGNSVVKTMNPYAKKSDKTLRDVTDINNALASLAHESLDVIYARSNRSKQGLGDIYQNLADAVGIERNEIEESMQQTFRTSCDLASDYGLDVKLLMPPVRASEDALLNKTARQLAFFAGTRAKNNGLLKDGDLIDEFLDSDETRNESSASAVKQEEKINVSKTTSSDKESATLEHQGNLQVQLSILQEITGLITSAAGVHHVFGKVLDGLHRGIGFKRVSLCLLNADHTELQMRLGVGDLLDPLKGYFDLQVRDKKNLFIKVLREGNELCVSDVNDAAWKDSIPEAFIKKVGVSSFMISALRAGNKPVGLFYVDNGPRSGPVNDIMQQGFIQFVSQAKLALQYAEMQRGK
ncbi:MAG: HDOD domain-containing protein [Sulfuriflexus sp.]|nr:HDOD domain-containing protein [Sulfuriflexus sp.]